MLLSTCLKRLFSSLVLALTLAFSFSLSLSLTFALSFLLLILAGLCAIACCASLVRCRAAGYKLRGITSGRLSRLVECLLCLINLLLCL